MENKIVIWILVLIVLLIAGKILYSVLRTTETSKAQYKKISAASAKQIMDSNKAYILLDVRTEEEFSEGHIKEAILIPDYELSEKAKTELPDKNAKILVYCRSGRRSAGSAKTLVKMGYTDVLDFGGIIDWPYEVVQD